MTFLRLLCIKLISHLNDNMNLKHYFLAFCLALLSTSLLAAIPANCDSLQQAKGYPEYYCDCKYDYTNFQLPLDTVISYEPIWLKGWVSDLYDGLSAYLHSDCDLNFEVYASCTAKEPRYKAIFTQNEASAIDGEAIKRKLEENQVGNLDVAFYICISPIGGKGGRLIMRKESDGMPSTCEDPLYMLPGMSLYSTQANDVYVIDPTELNELTDVILQWEPDMVSSCHLQVTSGSCDGPTIAQTTLETDDAYVLPAADIRQALQDNENLYLHFSHAANKAGMVRCLAPIYEENYIDTLLCQGMGLAVHDTLLTEPTVYTIDTIHDYSNIYLINLYNLEFYEPDLQYDTLAFKYTQSPYLYRGQHTINKPGNYDLTIHNPGQCDEHYQLYVYHDIDTVLQTVDTFLCYGAGFEYEKRLYQKDVSFGTATWKNTDTYQIDSLHVHFATTPEIVYDTISVNEEKYGKGFDTGDFSFTYFNATTHCVDSIILHVQPSLDDGVNYFYEYVDEELCQGLVYEDYGYTCTSSVVIRDSAWMTNDTCTISVITVTFIPPTPYYDTISIKSTALPYNYHGQKLTEFGTHDITIHVEEKCDERYILTLVHDIDTLRQTVDTALCQGTAFVHNGISYTQPVSLVEREWRDADTYVITTIDVSFKQPVKTSQTIEACDSYAWNDSTYTTSGIYTYTTTAANGCDSVVTLHLTINKTVYTEETVTACDSYDWNGMTYDKSDDYVYTTTAANGCDSVVTLHLTINKTVYTDESVTACDSYAWNDSTYTTSGIYTYTTTAVNGCDSVVTLHLTINKTVYTEETVTACDTYTWNGQTYDKSDDYVYTTTAANGCDSVVMLHLTINKTIYTEETIIACDSYDWNGNTYNQSGDYVYTTPAANGCDSVVTLHLTINNTVYGEETIIACDSYDWNGNTYNQSGDYVYTTTAANGCDSVVTLHLTINKTVYTEETVTACDSYDWNGMTYDKSDDYVYTTTAANGCDSVVTLHLTINKTVYTDESVTACDSYAWNDSTYTTSGIYTYTTTAANGCDSVVTLHLTMLPPAEIQHDSVYVCASDLPYMWQELLISEPGLYSHTVTYQSAQCDSVMYELVLGIYTQTLPAEINMPIVNIGAPIDVADATADIIAHIESNTWYAPNAFVKWMVKYDSEWEFLTDTPVDSKFQKLLLKYLVETDCGVMESDEMEYVFCTTNLGAESSYAPSVRKVFYQNTIYVIRDGKVYDALGIRIM